MTIGRLVEVLLDEAVPVLVAQVVVLHRADELSKSVNAACRRSNNISAYFHITLFDLEVMKH